MALCLRRPPNLLGARLKSAQDRLDGLTSKAETLRAERQRLLLQKGKLDARAYKEADKVAADSRADVAWLAQVARSEVAAAISHAPRNHGWDRGGCSKRSLTFSGVSTTTGATFSRLDDEGRFAPWARISMVSPGRKLVALGTRSRMVESWGGVSAHELALNRTSEQDGRETPACND